MNEQKSGRLGSEGTGEIKVLGKGRKLEMGRETGA